MDQYPTLNFLMRHGQRIAIALALAPIVAAGLAVAGGASWLWGGAGVVIGAIGYGLVLSYIELIKLVTDMLMPK